MSEYGDLLCPICMVCELTAATKVYPLCLCKLSICFDCLRRWAETKYCCPFCNIPFTQIALQQTEGELRIRLRGKVETGKLEEVVSEWADLLKHLRAEMEVGLTVLNMDSLGDDDDDGLYDLAWGPLQRSRTPFFPSDWGQISTTSSMFSNTRNTRLVPPSVSTNLNTMLIVQPSLSMSFTQQSNIQQVSPPQQSRNADNEKLPEGFSRGTGIELRSNANEILRHSSSSNSQILTTSLVPCFSYGGQTVPGDKIQLQDISNLTFGNNCCLRTDDLNLHTTPNNWVRLDSFRGLRNQSAGNLSAYSQTSTRVEELIRKNGSQVKRILSKQLKVRWLVRLLPETMSASKYGRNAVGVIMKLVKKLDFEGFEGFEQMALTVRLLDGSWLTKVPVEDLSSEGRRATLTEWLRIGDLLRTRFGICMAKELHPDSNQVTVQFLGRFIDPWECSSRNRHIIHEELRSVLYNSQTPSRYSQGDELKWDKRSQKEEIKTEHKPLGKIVKTPLSGKKIKYTVIPLLSDKDTDISKIDAEEERYFLDSDKINLPSPVFGRTERESQPFQTHSPTEDMEGEDMILENESTKMKYTVIPMLGRKENPSNFCQPATPQEEIIEKRTTDVRVVGWPPSGTKAKHTANAILSSKYTNIPRSEQEELLVPNDLKIDPSITIKSKGQSLLIQPATPNLGSEASTEDGIEEPFVQKSLLFTGLTNNAGSFVLPGRAPFHRKVGTRQSYVLESDVPEFNLPSEGDDKLAVRIIYDTDIKTVLSAQDLIARIEKRAERQNIMRTPDPIKIEIQPNIPRREL